MRILVYCQHVLGIGHLVRTFEILKALHAHEVVLLLGGAETKLTVPEHVTTIQLPPLMMDSSFNNLASTNQLPLEQVKEKRKQLLLQTLQEYKPDIFLVELYPFGRNAFHFELQPLLEQARKDFPSCLVASSVRDILVERDNKKKFEQRVIDRLNIFFDLLLVHSDPQVITLDETFSRMEDIAIPVEYTGYIHRPAVPPAKKEKTEKPFILASAGGGNVGFPLLKAAVEGHRLLAQSMPIDLRLYTGPYLEEEKKKMLQEMASEQASIFTFTENLPDEMRRASLSVSMGGYNTTMDILASGCPALIYPFSHNHEQRLRAVKMQDHASIRVLNDEDLTGTTMAELMQNGLNQKHHLPKIQLDGASRTAAILIKAHARKIAK